MSIVLLDQTQLNFKKFCEQVIILCILYQVVWGAGARSFRVSEDNYGILSQLWVQWLHVISLKTAMVGVYTMKLANTINQDYSLFFSERWLLNIYQHNIGFNQIL